MKNGHKIKKRDRARIKCHGVHALDSCGKPAEFCEHMLWSCTPVGGGKGISFFNYCATHWRTKGPDGRTPEERAR